MGRDPSRVLGEAVVVGIVFAICYALVYGAVWWANPDFAMSWTAALLSAAVAGALGHFAFEAAGLNAKFCKNF